MGETFIVNSLEEMCDMMCNNVVPKRKKVDKLKTGKILGTMVGLAVGDALGVPVEFMNWEQIHDRYGLLNKMVGGGTWGQKPGTVSDDTEMALAVAEGIINKPYNPVPAVGEKFIEWYKTNPFDIGVCCANVIRQMEDLENPQDYDWENASRYYDKISGGKSAGNGGLMRTAFCGVYYPAEHDVEKFAKDICGMTHHNEVARTDCALMSRIIHKLIDGGTKETIEDEIISYEDCNTRYSLGEIEGYPFKVEPSGYCVDSLACALKCVLTTRSFEQAVVMAVNMGGDTDTIGAITGAMAGALYGIDGIPKEWIQALDKKVFERITNVCTRAAVKRLGGIDKVVAEIAGKY